MPAGPRTIDPAPPKTFDRGGGGGWRWLVTASGLIEAELIRGVVEAAGVVPVVFDTSNPSPGAWLFPSGDVNAPVRIFVPASMLDAARLALLESGLSVESDEQADPDPQQPARSWTWMVATGLVVVVILVTVFRALVR